MQSFNSFLSERLPASAKVSLRRLAFYSLRLAEGLGGADELYPPAWMPLVGSGDFRTVGQEYFRYFTDLGGLQPSHSVLDVGCGLGRMAIPLTNFLDPRQGRYVGFDIEAEAIAWCQRRIARRFPNFTFIHLKAANPNYISATPIRQRPAFPAAERAFDFAIVTSVFTHLLPAEVEFFISELARVLKPGGRCLVTGFLLNAQSEALIVAGRSRFRFTHSYGRQRVINPDLPQAAIAYPEAQLRAWLAEYQLQVLEPIHYGNWCGREPFTDGQDIVIAQRL
jgi:SAM-dependent methyltransferase